MVLHTLQVEHAYLLFVYTLLTMVNARLQRNLRGVWLFAIYNALVLLGAIAVVLRGDIPNVLSIVVGNLCTIGGYTALYGSMNRLFRFRRRQTIAAAVWLGAGVVTMVWLGSVHPLTGLRLFAFSLILASQQFQLAALLLFRSGEGRRLAWMPGVFLVLLGLANLVRMVTLVEQGAPQDYRLAGPALAAVVLANACLQCGLMVSYVWMTAAQLRRDLEVQANTDPLTGLLNRRALVAAWQQRSAGHAHSSLISMDLDRYKPINDHLGHAAGDRALVAVAEMLARELRSGAVLARTGGDEFTILLPRTSAQQAMFVAERLRRSLESLDLGLGEARVTGSFGVAASNAGETWEQVCSRCDSALYLAKDDGGNAVRVYKEARVTLSSRSFAEVS